MKFKEYVETINDLANSQPECLEYDTVYSTDDEGNNFHLVFFKPSVGRYDGVEFMQEDEDGQPPDLNAICIN